MNLKRQAEAYSRAMGRQALERQLGADRCPECFGTKPAGHRSGCPYWGGREPLPQPRP